MLYYIQTKNKIMESAKFSEDIEELIKNELGDKDYTKMSLTELIQFREEVVDKHHEYELIEKANKTLGNAAYGACANQYFYFFNPSLAEDITGECRLLTTTFWDGWQTYFHETIWNDKELQHKFEFELDESKHDWYRQQQITPYSDTDSCYVTFGTLFQAFTSEYQERYNDDNKKRAWIMNFCVNHMDKQNRQWCENIYKPRFGQSIHKFELETIQKAGLFIAKKHNIKGVVWNKGKMIPCDKPKLEATGIELVKSTTPKIARDIQTDLILMLLYDYEPENANEFMLLFNSKLAEYRKKFYKSGVEDISQSVGIGNYKKYVEDDTNSLLLYSRCPVSVHSIARYNYMAHKNGQDNLKTYSGKIKYYNMRINRNTTGYFGYPSGELPSWAPPVDKLTQWQKNVIDPINRFLIALQLPLVGSTGVQQLPLF